MFDSPSQVPFFKFGYTVRHVIDDESPLAGLTMQDLIDGDASLVLSVSAQERSSLQPVFHVQVSTPRQKTKEREVHWMIATYV